MWAVFRNNYIDQDCEKITKNPRISQKRVGKVIHSICSNSNEKIIEHVQRRPKASKVYSQQPEDRPEPFPDQIITSRRPKFYKEIIGPPPQDTEVFPIEQNIKRRRPRMFSITPSESENAPISVVMGMIKRSYKYRLPFQKKEKKPEISLEEFLFTEFPNNNLHPNSNRKIPKNIFRTFRKKRA